MARSFEANKFYTLYNLSLTSYVTGTVLRNSSGQGKKRKRATARERETRPNVNLTSARVYGAIVCKGNGKIFSPPVFFL